MDTHNYGLTHGLFTALLMAFAWWLAPIMVLPVALVCGPASAYLVALLVIHLISPRYEPAKV